MTLTRALHSAHTGLAATSFRANIVAGNVANASNPDYVRREAISSERIAGGVGNGVNIDGVKRHQDVAVSRLRREADASLGRSSLIANTYNQLNLELGTPESEFGLFSSFQDLESTIKEFAATPESPALQSSMLQASSSLVDQLNSLSQLTNALRETADRDIARDVDTVNNALYQIRDLNASIASRNHDTNETTALEDQRQVLLNTVSEIIPIRDLPREDGRIEIMTTAGVFLLGSEVREVSFDPANVIDPTVNYGDGSNSLSSLSVEGQDITPGAGGNFSLTSGTMAGNFAIRDTIVPNFNSQLDSIAADLIERFSDDNIDSTKVAGAPGIFTDAGNALDPLNTSGLAGRIRLNAAVDPAQGGDITRFRDGVGAATSGPSGNSEILDNYLDALNAVNPAPADSGLVGSFSFSNLLAGFTSTVGENRVRYDAISSSASARQTLLRDAEIQDSGVDTDLEMQSLLLIEQAYAANARVIQVASDMLDRLMQI